MQLTKSTGLNREQTDQFYTSPEVAQLLINKLATHYDFSKFTHIIEPSAGAGAFSDWFKQHKYPIKAYDIAPPPLAKSYIKRQDFLNTTFSPVKQNSKQNHKILTIGNPPFGRQSTLAKQFIAKSATYSDVIAFILPKSFKKPSYSAAFPPNFHKIAQYELSQTAATFYIPTKDQNVTQHHVPCVFQIWERRDTPRKQVYKEIPKYITFVAHQSDADFAIRRIGVYAGTLYSTTRRTFSPNSHYFIKLNAGIELAVFETHYRSHVSFSHNNTVGPRSISKPELIKKVNRLGL